MLDAFFDYVDDLGDFYEWDERKTCCQALANLCVIALVYVRQAPFQPHM